MNNGLLTPFVQLVGGVGIDVVNNRTISVDADVELKVNKDQVSGYLGIDASGYANVDGLIPRTGTWTELDSVAPEDGEIGTTNDLPRVFVPAADGVWWPVSLNSADVFVLTPDDDAIKNGDRMRLAYTKIQSFTPNGLALSATNRAVLLLVGGKYELDGDLRLEMFNFCDIWGVANPEIICKIDSGGGQDNILNYAANVDANLTGLILSNKTPGDGTVIISFTGGTTPCDFIDITFKVGATNPTHSLTVGVIFFGDIENCHTDGINMFGGGTGCICTGNVKESSGGNNCFGAALTIGGAVSANTAKFESVRMFGSEWNGRIGDGFQMRDCEWDAQIPRVDSTVGATSAMILDSVLRGTPTSVGDSGSFKFIRMAHCNLATGIDIGAITNHFGGNDLSFNLINTDV